MHVTKLKHAQTYQLLQIPLMFHCQKWKAALQSGIHLCLRYFLLGCQTGQYHLIQSHQMRLFGKSNKIIIHFFLFFQKWMVCFLQLPDKHQSEKNMTKDVSGLQCKTCTSASTLINNYYWLINGLTDCQTDWLYLPCKESQTTLLQTKPSRNLSVTLQAKISEQYQAT